MTDTIENPPAAGLSFAVDDPGAPETTALLTAHLADMRAHSPEGSMHALDLAGLRDPAVTFWTARQGATLVGCGALKYLDAGHAEVKSMRTAAGHTGRGHQRLSLETGAHEYYDPARRLYRRHGFRDCGPFADYREDPHSVFMTRSLHDPDAVTAPGARGRYRHVRVRAATPARTAVPRREDGLPGQGPGRAH